MLLASNRLPVALKVGSDGGWDVSPTSGGLVTALNPVLQRRGGVWIGWPGAPGVGQDQLAEALDRTSDRRPYSLQGVPLRAEEVDLFYRGFCNEVVWPLFHGFPDRCNPTSGYWEAYQDVNRRFARALASTARWDDLIWIHDYHLMLAGKELRGLGMEHRLSFFLHIPFPSLELLRRIPQYEQLVEALCHFDLLGFQTGESRDNFLRAARHVVPDAFHAASVEDHPTSQVRPVQVQAGTISLRAGAFPISIDVDEFSTGLVDSIVAAKEREIHRRLRGRTLFLGVDRLDYSKGIPEKLRGFDRALERHPEFRTSLVLKQLVVPSRDRIPAYRETKAEIEGLVRSINDGMNLVAKEYATANGGSGVLILSAFAGSAMQLGSGALLVDPSQPEGLANVILRAYRMHPRERRERMAATRKAVQDHDVHRWVKDFLAEAVRAG